MNFRTIRYEKLGAVLRITANRPEVLNAQSRVMIVELDEAFRTATDDDATRAPSSWPARASTSPPATTSAAADELEDQKAHPGGPRHRGESEATVRALPRDVPALARRAQAHHRPGAGLLHHGRAHARLLLRSHHRGRRCPVRGSSRALGRLARAVLHHAVGAGPAEGQGVPLHGRLHRRADRPRARPRQPGRQARGRWPRRRWSSPSASRSRIPYALKLAKASVNETHGHPGPPPRRWRSAFKNYMLTIPHRQALGTYGAEARAKGVKERIATRDQKFGDVGEHSRPR